MSTVESKKFSENYILLAKVVKEIENLESQDIDELSDKVKKALEIAENCKDRVNKIKESIKSQFDIE